jgi:DNA-binding protein YbaB
MSMGQFAGRGANHALRARLDEVHGQYERLRAGMGELQRRLAGLAVSASSPDQLITATVGARGQLLELRLQPRAYRYEPSTLARRITETVQAASTRAGDEVCTVMAEYFPADSPALRYLRSDDFGAMVSQFDPDKAGAPQRRDSQRGDSRRGESNQDER